MSELTFALRLIIAATLIASAMPKRLAPLRFRQIVMQYAVLPPGAVGPFSRALPRVEGAPAAALSPGGGGPPLRLYQLAGHAIPTHAALGALVLLTRALSFALGYLIRWRPHNRKDS